MSVGGGRSATSRLSGPAQRNALIFRESQTYARVHLYLVQNVSHLQIIRPGGTYSQWGACAATEIHLFDTDAALPLHMTTLHYLNLGHNIILATLRTRD